MSRVRFYWQLARPLAVEARGHALGLPEARPEPAEPESCHGGKSAV